MKLLLQKLVSSPDLHIKWLNTLSYLEYVGTRKIAKVLESDTVSVDELQHLAEESRHAYFFKKIGHKNFHSFPLTFQEKDLLGGKAAKIYFQSLDQMISTQLGPGSVKIQYLYVTFLIEKRAMEVYTLYEDFLVKNEFSFSLISLLREEASHLQEAENFLKNKDSLFLKRYSIFSELEQKLFDTLLETLKKDAFSTINLSSQQPLHV